MTPRPALALAALLLAAPAFAQAPATAPTTPPVAGLKPAAPAGTVLARVDGRAITEAEVKIAEEDLAAQLPRVPEAQRREYLLGYLVDLHLAARAAEAAKLDQGPEFAAKLAYARDKALLDEYLAREGAKATGEAAMQAFYDETVKNLKPEVEARARHILVPTEEEATKAAERVGGGEDFAKVAGEVSKDPGSGKQGGDLGYFTRDRMVKEFADAAFALEPGQVSKPVKSQFGWHVIKLEDKRNRPVPPLAEVREELAQFLARKAQQDAVVALRKDAKIEQLDKAQTPRPTELSKPGTPAPK